jgi:hypothetical protein
MAESDSSGLSDAERAELERLRQQTVHHHRRWARGGRWVGASVLLILASLLATLAVVAVYVRAEVLNTDTYVATVAPLAQQPAVRDALAHRLADEIVTRSDVTSLATQAADQLETRGAPRQLSDLVGPLVSGLNSFLYGQINGFLGTQRFQTIWETVNREAHKGLVTVLTGKQGQVLKSQGNTVTLDLGALMAQAKQQLVAQGFTLAAKVPNVSISYTLVQSDKLPKVRSATRLLNAVGTWLPWISLLLLIAGIAVAPNRRRGLVTGAVMLVVATGLLLIGMNAIRSYYLDHLPSGVSADAVTEVYDTVLRFLLHALQALLTAAAVFGLGALVMGPSRPATWIRTWVNRGLDALGHLARRAGSWLTTVGHAIDGPRLFVYYGLILLTVIILLLRKQPSVGSVLWASVIVALVCALVEVVVRSGRRALVAS